MSEMGPGPSEEEMGIEPKGSSEDTQDLSPEEQQTILTTEPMEVEEESIASAEKREMTNEEIGTALLEVGIDIAHPENNQFPDRIKALTLLKSGIDLPSLSEFFARLEEAGRPYYTLEGISIVKLLARESFLAEKAHSVPITRASASTVVTPGMLVMNAEGIFRLQRVRMEFDPNYNPDLKKKTRPVFTVLDSEGQEREYGGVAGLYFSPPKTLPPESITQELAGQSWQIGERVRVGGIDFPGVVADFRDNDQVVVMLRNYKNMASLYLVPASELEKV
ncbi:MAG TPA: hypothetical protein VLE93_01440 [Candidatus Saccharimonadales bacterium]|nr:hypothetical protein [Candidatus Saccharimonadales bacterium]